MNVEWLTECVDDDENFLTDFNEPQVHAERRAKGHPEHIGGFGHDRMMREVAFKRKILAEAASLPHYYNDGDPWYSCSQSVIPDEPDEPGSGCIDDGRRGKPCDCGRDAQAARMLAMLAEVYSDRAGYAEAIGDGD